MGDEVHRGTGRQRAGQLERVVDRAFRQRAVLEGVDALAVAVLEGFPVGARRALQRIEAAGGAGAGAVDHHEQRAAGGVALQRGVAGIEAGAELAVGPAVEARVTLQAAFDRPHQRLGADPAHAELGVLLDPVLGLDAEPFARLAAGGVDDRVGRLSDGEREDLRGDRRQAVGHGIAQAAAQRGAALAQGALEHDGAVGIHRLRVHARQRLAQVLRMRDDGDALGQLQHHHLTDVGGDFAFLAPRIGGARGGRQVVRLIDAQQALRQERIVIERRGAAQRALQDTRQAAGRLKRTGSAMGGRS